MLSSSVFLSITTVAVAEKFEDVCENDKSTCNAVQYGSKLIGPAYDVKSDSEAKDKLSKLGWNQVESVKFVEKKDSLNVSLDAQALIAKRQEGDKTYYLFDFRGTESFGDFLIDANAILTNFSEKILNPKFIQVLNFIQKN